MTKQAVNEVEVEIINGKWPKNFFVASLYNDRKDAGLTSFTDEEMETYYQEYVRVDSISALDAYITIKQLINS